MCGRCTPRLTRVTQGVSGVWGNFRTSSNHAIPNAGAVTHASTQSGYDRDVNIDIVIPVYNGSAYIIDCLTSVLAQSLQPRRIIVVDDCSQDQSVRVVLDRGLPVQLIRQPVNQGFARTVNAGIAHTDGSDAVLMLNQDVVLAPDFLEVIARTLATTNAGIVGAQLNYPDRPEVQHAGGWIHWPSAEGHHYTENAPSTPDFVTGAALVLSRGALDRLGGLDEQISRAYYEDVDLCFRARAAGFDVRYEAAAKGLHRQGSVLGSSGYTHGWNYHCGRIGFLLRHGTLEQIAAGTALEEHTCAMTSDHEDYLARTRAYLYQVVRMGDIWQKRRALYPQRSVGEAPDAWRMVQERLLALAARYSSVKIPHSGGEVEPPSTQLLDGRLEEFTFQSSLPLIGPLLACVRSAVHSFAGRWALRHVVNQQSQINAYTLHLLKHTQQSLEWTQRSLERTQQSLEDMQRIHEESVRRMLDLAHRLQELENQLPADHHA